MGGEGFVESLIYYLQGYKDIKEIPKNQRYVYRPGLDTLFDEGIRSDRNMRKQQAIVAVERYGYSQKEVAEFLGIHSSVVSRMVRR